jgi:TDG/mug DNA glycosylase family protein
MTPPKAGTGRPTPADLLAAAGATVPDVIAGGLNVLFCGINPGLWSGAVGHHFARPGNRFWKLLHISGFTTELLSPFEDCRLLVHGIGITNLVERATASATEIHRDELRQGAERLGRKLQRFRPKVLAVLGIGAYRTAFDRPHATIGEQPETADVSRIWLLANPSGAQARYQMDEMVLHLRMLRQEVGRLGAGEH